MKHISTGQPSTLGTYRMLAVLYGPKAVAHMDKLIAEAPNGDQEEVIADETQMMHLLARLTTEQTPEEEAAICAAMDAMLTLKDLGYAVVIWTPEELGNADPSEIESIMIERGAHAIDSVN